MKKVFYTLMVLFLSVVSVEGVLQVSSYLYFHTNSDHKIINKESYRILALGESTTDNSLARGYKSWPEMLGSRLSSKFNVQVFNKGKAATNSAFILKNLNNYLRDYQPNLVITMIGINDGNHWIYDVENSVFNNIKLFKIFKYFFTYFKNRNLIDLPSHNLKNTDVINFYERISKMSRSKQFKAIDDSNFSKRQKAKILSNLGKDLLSNINIVNDLNILEMTLAYYEKSISYGHVFMETYYDISHLDINHKRCENLIDILKIIQTNNYRVQDFYYSLIQRCSYLDSELVSEINVFLNDSSFSYVKQESLIKNYKEIIRKVRDYGADIILMQYPNINDSLNIYSDEKEGVFHVYNFINFQEHLKTNDWSTLFVDSFAFGRFGHTTQLGYQLITNNLIPKVEELILE